MNGRCSSDQSNKTPFFSLRQASFSEHILNEENKNPSCHPFLTSTEDQKKKITFDVQRTTVESFGKALTAHHLPHQGAHRVHPASAWGVASTSRSDLTPPSPFQIITMPRVCTNYRTKTHSRNEQASGAPWRRRRSSALDVLFPVVNRVHVTRPLVLHHLVLAVEVIVLAFRRLRLREEQTERNEDPERQAAIGGRGRIGRGERRIELNADDARSVPSVVLVYVACHTRSFNDP